jgi:hypothetical protein
LQSFVIVIVLPTIASTNSNSVANTPAASTFWISIAPSQSLLSNSMAADTAFPTNAPETRSEISSSPSKESECCAFGITSCAVNSKRCDLKSGTR